jgi:hypothetical protein
MGKNWSKNVCGGYIKNRGKDGKNGKLASLENQAPRSLENQAFPGGDRRMGVLPYPL